MSDPDAPALDPDALIGALERHQVSFVAVGGLAAQWQGAGRPTKDLDVCPAWDRENLDRVVLALQDLGARLKIGDSSSEGVSIPIDAVMFSRMEITTWRTDAGDLDILLGIPRPKADEHLAGCSRHCAFRHSTRKLSSAQKLQTQKCAASVRYFGAVVERSYPDYEERAWEEVLHRFDEMLTRQGNESGEHWIKPLWSRFDQADGKMHGLVHVSRGFQAGQCECPPCASRAQVSP